MHVGNSFADEFVGFGIIKHAQCFFVRESRFVGKHLHDTGIFLLKYYLIGLHGSEYGINVSCQYSSLFHVLHQIFHDIFFGECVQNIIAWYYVVRYDASTLQFVIYIASAYLQMIGKASDTEDGEVE